MVPTQVGKVLVCSRIVLSRKSNALFCEFMLHASVHREILVVAAEGLLQGGFKMRACMLMASAREQRCPRIAAKNPVLVFPPVHESNWIRFDLVETYDCFPPIGRPRIAYLIFFSSQSE